MDKNLVNIILGRFTIRTRVITFRIKYSCIKSKIFHFKYIQNFCIYLQVLNHFIAVVIKIYCKKIVI